jgi:hypothetical protein
MHIEHGPGPAGILTKHLHRFIDPTVAGNQRTARSPYHEEGPIWVAPRSGPLCQSLEPLAPTSAIEPSVELSARTDTVVKIIVR